MRALTTLFLVALGACTAKDVLIEPGPRPKPLEGYGDVLTDLSLARANGIQGRLAGDTLFVLVVEHEGLDQTLHHVGQSHRVLAVDRHSGKTTELPELPSWGDGSWALAHEAGTDGVLIFTWTTGGPPRAHFSNGGAWQELPLDGLQGTLVPQDTWLFDGAHVLARTELGWFAWNGSAWNGVSALGLTAEQLGAFGADGFRVNAPTADEREFCSTLFGWEGQQLSRSCLTPPVPGRWKAPPGSQQGTSDDFTVALDLVSDARVCGGTDGLVYRFQSGTWTQQTGDGMPLTHVVSAPGELDAWLEANPENWDVPELRHVKDGAVTVVGGTFRLVGGTCAPCVGHSFTTRPQTWVRGGELIKLWQESFEVQRVLRLFHTPLPWSSPGFAARSCSVEGLNCEGVSMRCEIGPAGFASCFQRKEIIDPTPALHAVATLPDPAASSDGVRLSFEVLDAGHIFSSSQQGTTVDAEVDPGDYRLTATWDAGLDLPPVAPQSAATHVEMCQTHPGEISLALSFGQRVGPALGEPVFAHHRASGTTLLRGGTELFAVQARDEHHVSLAPLGAAEGFANFSARGGLVALTPPGGGGAMLVEILTGARVALGVTDDVRTFQLAETARRALVPRNTSTADLWSWPTSGVQDAMRGAAYPVDARLSADGRWLAWGGNPLSRTELDTGVTVTGPTQQATRTVHAITDAGRVVVRQVNGAGFLFFVERWDGMAWVRTQLPEFAFNVGVASGDAVFWLEKATMTATTATLKVQRGAAAATTVSDGASVVTARAVLSLPTWPNTSEQAWMLQQEDGVLLSLAATNHLALVDVAGGTVTQRVSRAVSDLDADCTVTPCVTHWLHGAPAVLDTLPVGGLRPGVRVQDDRTALTLTLVGGGRNGGDLVVMRRSAATDYQAVPVQPGMPCAPYTRTVRSPDVPDTFVTELFCVR